MDDSAIMPGSPVHSADGDFGQIERVITGPGGIDLEGVVVRLDPSGHRYRIPAALIDSVRSERGRDVVYLSAANDELERYHIHDASVTTDEPTQITYREPTAHPTSGGGLIERLQQGLESLTTGVRGALEGHAHEHKEFTEDDEALRVPVIEEEIITQTEAVRTGTLRVHKTVETEQQTLTVSVSHEEPEVDYIAVEDYDAKAPYHQGETYIPIVGEKIVVEKRQVVTGYLRVRKRMVAEDQQVTETVRKERVNVQEETLRQPG